MATIDAGIYNALSQPRKSAFDYAREFEDQDMQREQMGMARQQNALALRTGQMKADEYTRGVERQNLLRGVQSGWGADTTDDQRITALKNGGFFQEADSLEKTLLERQKTGAEVKNKEAMTAKTQGEVRAETLKQYRSALDFIDTPQGAVRWLQAQYADPVAGQYMQSVGGPVEEAVKRIPITPKEFQDWRQRAALGMEKYIEEQRAAATQQESMRHNKATEGLTARGQNMTDTRARELAQVTRDNTSAIRKETADDKAVTKFSDTLQKEGIPDIDAALGAAEGVFAKFVDPKTGKVGDMPGVGRITNALPDWAVSDEGKAVRSSLAAVSNIVLSARSGAAVTDSELRRLARELQLSTGGTAEGMRDAYAKFRERFEKVKANAAAGVSDEVKKTYEDRGGIKIQRGGGSPAPATQTPSGGAFSDAEKERRYQEWKAQQK